MATGGATRRRSRSWNGARRSVKNKARGNSQSASFGRKLASSAAAPPSKTQEFDHNVSASTLNPIPVAGQSADAAGASVLGGPSALAPRPPPTHPHPPIHTCGRRWSLRRTSTGTCCRSGASCCWWVEVGWWRLGQSTSYDRPSPDRAVCPAGDQTDQDKWIKSMHIDFTELSAPQVNEVLFASLLSWRQARGAGGG